MYIITGRLESRSVFDALIFSKIFRTHKRALEKEARFSLPRLRTSENICSLRKNNYMQYDKYDRQAIKSLSPSAIALFGIIETEEKGEIVDVPGLCSVLTKVPEFVIFSCLSGNGEREELGQDLGVLFATNLRAKAERFMDLLACAGFMGRFQVIVDDTEPVKFWNWGKSQSEITTWCQMVIEEADIPKNWEVKLWSGLESGYAMLIDSGSGLPPYSEFYASKIAQVKSSVLFHKLFQHIRNFPNKGLQMKNVSVEKATTDKLVQYQFQQLVLRRMMANGVLIQTETPWEIKDPLFHGPLGNSFGSIIHPFERRR